MLDLNRVTLYATEIDTCIIGCGTRLIFLKWVPKNKLLFWCLSCQGIWNESLFISDEPRLYSAEEFGVKSLTPSNESEIRKTWHHKIESLEGDEKKFYFDWLNEVLGDKLVY